MSQCNTYLTSLKRNFFGYCPSHRCDNIKRYPLQKCANAEYGINSVVQIEYLTRTTIVSIMVYIMYVLTRRVPIVIIVKLIKSSNIRVPNGRPFYSNNWYLHHVCSVVYNMFVLLRM